MRILDLCWHYEVTIVLILTIAVVSAFHLDLKKNLLNIIFHVAENQVWVVLMDITFSCWVITKEFLTLLCPPAETSRVKIFIANGNWH